MRASPRPRAEVAALRAYRIAQPEAVKLNQNESPLDWPPELKAEVLRRLAARPWNRYPSVDAEALRAALAESSGVAPEMVAVANGSNEAILSLVEAFASGGAVATTAPGYSMAAPLAVVGGATVVAVPLRDDFALDVAAMTRAAARAEMVFLASPNNPTGNAFERAAVEAVLGAARGLVVVDEAYAGFARDSFLPDLPAHPNLAVVRTFSKAFALAGARVGWINANAPVIAAVQKTVPPFTLDLFAQEAALAALEHRGLLAARLGGIVAERERMRAAMARLPGIVPYRSDANFILFRTAVPPAALFDRLLRRGVLVRDVSSYPMLEHCLRVTVGTPDDNDRFLRALEESL